MTVKELIDKLKSLNSPDRHIVLIVDGREECSVKVEKAVKLEIVYVVGEFS